MHADHVFKVLDIHAGGAPTRLVYSGLPHIEGSTMMEKMRGFAANYDWIRTSLVLEPRGKDMTSAVVLTEPTRSDAHVGAFFMESHGYLPMCGSDTIATTTALVETGQVPVTGPDTAVRIDTPAGLIKATAHVEPDGHVSSVTFLNAPAFCAAHQRELHVPGYGSAVIDVAYGGNFYVITDARQFGLDFDPLKTHPMVDVASALRKAANNTIPITHPTLPEVTGATHVQLFWPPDHDGGPTPVVVIIPTGQIDRSPCGTGTTAKVAALLAQGRLQLDQPFTHRSLTGAKFTGCAVATTTIGTIPGCRVTISGSAYIIADATIYVDRRDEVAKGFRLA